jgi:cytoskeleton protein RodZ
VVRFVGLRVEPGVDISGAHCALLEHTVVNEDRCPDAHGEVERVAWAGVEFVDAPVDGDGDNSVKGLLAQAGDGDPLDVGAGGAKELCHHVACDRKASERTLSQFPPVASSAGHPSGQTVRSRIMFKLGSSLRDARVRRGIELSQVAAETQIRTRYLQALEDERFELLPGSVYAKGFLRAYADYLGLESQLFVDEYNARFNADETPPAPPQLKLRPRPLRLYGIAATVLLLALAGALLTWQLNRSSPRPVRSRAASAAAAGAPAPATPRTVQPTTRRASRPTKPAAAALVLRATHGPCWLSVRVRSEHGRYLFEGTLEPGDSRRFADGQLWIRIGAPWNLEASLAGRRLSLPQTVANVVVTANGIRSPATG